MGHIHVKRCVTSQFSFPPVCSRKELVNSNRQLCDYVLRKQTGRSMVNPAMPGGNVPLGLLHNQLNPSPAGLSSRETEHIGGLTEQDLLQ